MTPEYRDFVELLENLRSAPRDLGVRFVDRRFRETFLPYADLHREIRRKAMGLKRQGVAAGERVAVALATEPDVLASFFGLIYLGAIPVSVHQPLVGQSPEAYLRQLAELVRSFEIERVLLDARFRDTASGLGVFAPGRLLDLEGGATTPPDDAGFTPARVRPEDVAFVQFSSGSTSNPKGVLITHRNIVTNLGLILGHAPREPRHVGASWLPLYHDMGLIGGFLSHFVLPNTVVLMHTLCFLMRPVSWLSVITRHKVDGTVSPNFALDVCALRITDKMIAENQLDLRSLQYMVLGAEPIHPASVERFTKRFAPHGFDRRSIYPGYGMAEATLLLTLVPYGREISWRKTETSEVASVGRPLGDTEIRILDGAGRELGPGTVGEIVARGASLSPGYLKGPGVPSDRFRHGWFHTGDLGLIDETGDLYITGRLKDLIIVSGRNFYGHDIATKVEELPQVAKGKVYAFGVRVDEREGVVVMAVPARLPAGLRQRTTALQQALGLWGQLGWLASFFLAGLTSLKGQLKPATAEELTEAIRKHVFADLGLAIDEVLLVPRIPKTTSGKVNRAACEAMYWRAREARGA